MFTNAIYQKFRYVLTDLPFGFSAILCQCLHMTTVAAQIICLEKAHLGYGVWCGVVATIMAGLAKNKSNIQTKVSPLPATTVRKLKLHAKVLDFRLLTVLFWIDDIPGLAKSREERAAGCSKGRTPAKIAKPCLLERPFSPTKAKVFLRVRSFNY